MHGLAGDGVHQGQMGKLQTDLRGLFNGFERAKGLVRIRRERVRRPGTAGTVAGGPDAAGQRLARMGVRSNPFPPVILYSD